MSELNKSTIANVISKLQSVTPKDYGYGVELEAHIRNKWPITTDMLELRKRQLESLKAKSKGVSANKGGMCKHEKEQLKILQAALETWA